MEKLSQLQITHCIFDLDGTLIDTALLYRKAMVNVVNGFKKECPTDLLNAIANMSMDEAIKTIQQQMKLDVPFEILRKRYIAESTKIISENKLMPGVERLVRHLTLFKIPMALCTSSDEKLYAIKIKKHTEFFKLFNPIVFGSDPLVKYAKPAPDIYLAALNKFPDHPSASNCLVFEDTAHGVISAAAAGLHVIMVTKNIYKKSDTKVAVMIVPSVEGLDLRKFGLPPLAEE